MFSTRGVGLTRTADPCRMENSLEFGRIFGATRGKPMDPIWLLSQPDHVGGIRMAKRLGWGLMLVVGCAGGDPSSGLGSFGPGAWPGPEGGTGDESDPSDTDGATSVGTTSTERDDETGAMTLTSGPMDSSDDGSTTGPPPPPPPMEGTMGGTFGDDSGGQPDSGPYSQCVGGSCEPGLTCIVPELIVDDMCVESCLPAGDPSSCTPAPGGDSTPICLAVNGSSYCALDCSGGRSCPSGMVCHDEADDSGPQSICI